MDELLEIKIKSAKQIIENGGECAFSMKGSPEYTYCGECPLDKDCPVRHGFFLIRYPSPENHRLILKQTKKWLAENEPIDLEKEVLDNVSGWRIGKSGNPNFDLCILDTDGGSICHFTRWSNAEENARKMVLADEMLKALIELMKDVLNEMSQEDGKRYYSNEIKLIEKATWKKWEDING